MVDQNIFYTEKIVNHSNMIFNKCIVDPNIFVKNVIVINENNFTIDSNIFINI